MWRALAFSLPLIAVLAPAAFAQHKFEISPYAGVRLPAASAVKINWSRIASRAPRPSACSRTSW